MIVKNKCINCANSYSGYAESSMHYSLRCELDDSAVSENGTCESFKLNDYHKLKFQIEKNTELQSKLDKAVEALKLAIKSASFFMGHADCRKDSWCCNCTFCRDKDSSKNLRLACETLKELGVE